MELHFSEINTPPTPAATVILLRSGEQGLEVLLQKRHSQMAVLGGAYVFPGGKVAPEDHASALAQRLDAAPEALHQQLAQSDIDLPLATAFYIAGLRELLEESTIWLGASHNHKPLAGGVDAPAQGFLDWLTQHDLSLPASTLVPWSRWITPKLASVTRQRFDTVFFVAQMPHHQEAAHDHQESTATLWVSPRQALTQYWQHEVELAPPQIMTLAHLSRFDTPAAALADARGRPAFLVEPHAEDVEGTRWLCYPGDSAHSVAQQHMPGPSRLAWRNKRFEPVGGLEAFFGDATAVPHAP